MPHVVLLMLCEPDSFQHSNSPEGFLTIFAEQ